MPIREFVCRTCGFKVERIEFTPDPNVPVCPRCYDDDDEPAYIEPMERVISQTSFSLKGDGWTRPSNYHNAPKGTHPVDPPKGD